MERRLAAILAADVVGYSRLMGADEGGTFASLKAHRAEVFDPKLSQYNGRTIKLMGDGALMEFPSVVEAVTFAIEVQFAMKARNADAPANEQILFRIGINIGDVIVDGDDLYGDGVNVAARLEGLAQPGGICLSRAARDQVRDRIDVALHDNGEIEIKNIARPVRAFSVVLDERAQSLTTPIEAHPQAAGRNRKLAVSRFGWRIAVAALASCVAIVGVLTWWQPWTQIGKQNTTSLSLPDRPSVAILPFDNLGDDPAQEYFADGLTDDLITDLSKVSGLFVIARNSVFAFKGKAVPVNEIAEELGVHYVVEGSVRRGGNRVRVNAQLIEGRTGIHVWAERYDREIGDLFAVQDDLVSRIVSALAVQLTQIEEVRLAQRLEPPLRAYDLYLKARDGYFSRDQIRMRESLGLYAQAWTIDPAFAKAYAGYAQLAADIWRLSSLREAMGGATARKAAEVAANKALALDPTLADAYSVLAIMRVVDKEYADATELATRAVELEPNSADAYTARAIVLGYAGRPEAALESMRTSVRLNPRPTPYHLIYYGWTLFLNRRYEAVIEVLEPIAETRDRGLGDAPREILAMAYAKLGRLQEARVNVDALRKAEPYLNVAFYRVMYDHHAREEDLQDRLDALREAGMPTWPFDFEGDAEQRLSGPTIKDLITARTWSGNDVARQSFVQEFGENDSAVYAGADTMLNGTAFVRGDELCERFEGFILGRDLCGPVFRTERDASGNEYAYVNPATVKYFSVAR